MIPPWSHSGVLPPFAGADPPGRAGSSPYEASCSEVASHPKWNIQLHYDNLKLVGKAGQFPSYGTTVSLDGVRFEIPQAFGHLRELTLRDALWDLSRADLVDPRTGIIQATIYPLDKTRHADGRRRLINKPTGVSSRPVASLKDSTRTTASPSDTQAPLLRHLLAEFAATGLPAAYIEFDDTSDTSSTLEPTI